MKAFLILFGTSVLCAYAQPKNADDGLIFYNTNLRDGGAFIVDGPFGTITPHNGTLGIVMSGGSPPGFSDDYTAPPHGPLVFSFVGPKVSRAASVNRVDFWISNRMRTSSFPKPVRITVFDPQGRTLTNQESSEFEFPVSVQNVGPIGSVQVFAESLGPQYLMVSDIHFARPQLIHAQDFVVNDPEQFQKAVTTIDFEALPNGSLPGVFVSDEWSELGVVFSDENGNSANIYPAIPDNLLATRSGTNGLTTGSHTLEISFVKTKTAAAGVVTEAGLWIVNAGFELALQPTTVQFLNADGQVLETVTSSGKYFFAGAHSKKGIAKIVLSDADSFLADDLQFSAVRKSKGPSSDEDFFPAMTR